MSNNIVLRNYLPKDANLKSMYSAPTLPPDVSAVVNADETNTFNQLGSKIGQQQSSAQSEEISILPRHPNWDLKRDLAPMMALLERRTQRAIVEIVRERLGNASTKSVATNSDSTGSKESKLDSSQSLDEEYKGPIDTVAVASALRRAGEGLRNDDSDEYEDDGELARIRAKREQRIDQERTTTTTQTQSTMQNNKQRDGIKSAGATLTDETIGVAAKRRRYDSDNE
jgi:coiled-coil domain-containing protein 12